VKIIDIGICQQGKKTTPAGTIATDNLTILIPPVSGTCPTRIHDLLINPDGGDCPCVPPDAIQVDGPVLSWEGTDKEVPDHDTPDPDDTKTETTKDNYPTISFGAPSTCKWAATNLIAFAEGYELLTTLWRSGVDKCDPTGKYSAQQKTNQIVPGSKLEIVHYLNCNPPGNIITGDHDWWRNCCINGGVIMSINGDIDATDMTFTVRVFGTEIPDVSVPPSDFVVYGVGDWVILLLIGGACAETDNKGSLETDGDFYMAVPFKVGDFLTTTSCESIDFDKDDNRSLFGLRALPATIIEMGANDTADVETDRFGRLNGVPIHYHCPGQITVDGGSAGFAEEDEVVLAIADVAHDAHVPGPDQPPQLRWIIGHLDGIRRTCVPDYWMFELTPRVVLVYDLNANKIATDIPDGYGGFLHFPCWSYTADISGFVYDYWLTQTDAVVLSDMFDDSEVLGMNGLWDGRETNASEYTEPTEKCGGVMGTNSVVQTTDYEHNSAGGMTAWDRTVVIDLQSSKGIRLYDNDTVAAT